MLDACRRDLVYAARGFRKQPAFAATAVLTLALGIGGITAMFSVIHAVLLKPLDYPEPDRLVSIEGGASPTRFRDLKANSKSFSALGAYVPNEENLTLTGGAEPEVLRGVRVSANFLDVLGTPLVTGRSFFPAEDSPGGTPVAIISSELWTRRYNRDPQIAGKVMTLSDVPYSIIGVLPSRFQFPLPDIDIWITKPDEWPMMPAKSRLISPFLNVFGRLRNDVSLQQANAELVLVHHRYATEHSAMLDAKAKSPVELKFMKDELVTDIRSTLWMLFGAVGFVLFITCANVASLMLARARTRGREFAVRAAIGASGRRLLGHLLAEGVLVSMAGGTIGIGLAMLSLRFIRSLTITDLPRSGENQLDWFVLLFAVAISLATGVLFGLVPSFSAARPDLISVMRGTGAAASDGSFNMRHVLVVAQIAFSIVLLIGATLMIQSAVRLRGVSVGFNAANLLTGRISMPALRYETPQKQASFVNALLDRLGSTPGVDSAAAAMTLPMGDFAGTPVQDAAQPALRLNERPIATVGVVAPKYFQTLQIPFRRGRDFSLQDRKEAERVAIIDEALARRFWPLYPKGVDPVGQHLLIGGVNPNPARIIGIVPVVRQNLQNTAWPETVYVTFNQSPQSEAMLAIRTQGDPHRLTSAVRQVVQRLDRDLPVSEVNSMEDRMDLQLGRHRIIVDLLGTFAAVALVLALVGIYGTISYSVTQRTQEIGIRSALGAEKTDILKLVVGQGLILACCGIAFGLVASFWLTQALKEFLFGVTGTDPATFVGIGVIFALSAAIASYIPARRAARLDPMAALRI